MLASSPLGNGGFDGHHVEADPLGDVRICRSATRLADQSDLSVASHHHTIGLWHINDELVICIIFAEIVNYVAKFLDGSSAQKLLAEHVLVIEGQSATLLVGDAGYAGLQERVGWFGGWKLALEPEHGWHLPEVELALFMSQFNGFDVPHGAVQLDEADVVVVMLTQKIKWSFMIAALWDHQVPDSQYSADASTRSWHSE
jgi:hypothetical protein